MHNNLNDQSTEGSVEFRWFPIRLYTYVFGAGIFGWGTGTAMQDPSTTSLIALLVGAVSIVIGYYFMRPFIAASKRAIKVLDEARTTRAGGAHDVDV